MFIFVMLPYLTFATMLIFVRTSMVCRKCYNICNESSKPYFICLCHEIVNSDIKHFILLCYVSSFFKWKQNFPSPRKTFMASSYCFVTFRFALRYFYMKSGENLDNEQNSRIYFSQLFFCLNEFSCYWKFVE